MVGLGSFLFKLIFAPLMLATVSVVSRRWGTSIAGSLAALPVVAGSITFFVSLERGPAFGSQTAAAALVGIASLGWFSLAYAHASGRLGWPWSIVLGYLAVLVASVAVIPLGHAPGLLILAFTLAVLRIAYRLMPAARPDPRLVPPRWDIPARMVTGAVVVVVLTAVAGGVGPQVSGLLAAFPLMTSVLLVFTHRHEGAEQARGLLRGFLTGLVATSVFLEIAADGIVPLGLGPALGLGIAACLAYQAAVIHFAGSRPLT